MDYQPNPATNALGRFGLSVKFGYLFPSVMPADVAYRGAVVSVKSTAAEARYARQSISVDDSTFKPKIFRGVRTQTTSPSGHCGGGDYLVIASLLSHISDDTHGRARHA